MSSSIPHPDPDPAPCYANFNTANHGTHVAGTASGYGVIADGSTNTGPYSTSLNFGNFSDFGATRSVTATTLFFAVAARGSWSAPLAPDVQFKVFIDTDRNGTDDFVLSNAAIRVKFDADAYMTNGSIGALILHHHNAVPGRTEIISINP